MERIVWVSTRTHASCKQKTESLLEHKHIFQVDMGIIECEGCERERKASDGANKDDGLTMLNRSGAKWQTRLAALVLPFIRPGTAWWGYGRKLDQQQQG